MLIFLKITNNNLFCRPSTFINIKISFKKGMQKSIFLKAQNPKSLKLKRQ